MDERKRYEAGLAVRRAVLGDAYVDQSLANLTPFNAPFQNLITRYAWGEIWDRPGLPRQTRSLITLALLVALNRGDELRMHIRAALRNGVTIEDYPERQVLGYRWPVIGGNSRTLRAQTAGVVGDVLTTSSLAMATMPEALAVSSDRQSLASLWPWFGVIGITLSIAARLVTIWARTSDWQAKGV